MFGITIATILILTELEGFGMVKGKGLVEIAAPAGRVWDWIIEPEKYLVWNLDFREYKIIAEKEEKVGTDAVERTDYKLLGLFGLLFFIYISIEVSYGGWIYSYALITEPGNVGAASNLTSAFWLAITAGRLVMIPVTARVHPRYILMVSLSGALASLGLMLLLSYSFAAVVIGTIGLGFSIASMSPVTLSLVERSMPVHGRTTGWLWVCGSAGAIITPWLVGRAIGAFYPAAMIGILGVYAAVGILVFLSLNIYRARNPIPAG